MAFERNQGNPRDHVFNMPRPDRPLVVKCTFDRWNKRITFTSARNCTYTLLRQKVEQGFALSASSYSIAYKDDDGEITDITNEADLTEAIHYFQASVDDMPTSSAASILSGRSFGSRKITLRVHISVDYDGPALSDTSSLASLDDYKHSNGSELSLSLPQHLAPVEIDDDSVTVSSRDMGRSPSHRPVQVIPPPEDQLTHLGSWDQTSLNGDSQLGTESYLHVSPPRSYAPGPSAVLERLRLEDAGHSASSISPHWLNDQTARMTAARLGGEAPEDSVVDSAESLALGPESPSANPLDGELALQQDTRGKWYYSYKSSSSSAPSQTHDSGFEESLSMSSVSQDVSLTAEDGVGAENRPTSMEMTLGSQRPYAMPKAKAGSYPFSSRSRPHSFRSDPTPLPAEYNGMVIDPSIPPEVLQYVTFPSPPSELTDCSACGAWLDSFRYVCSTCGEKHPRAKDVYSAGGGASPGGKGKAREESPIHEPHNPFLDPHAYPPPLHRSPASSNASSFTLHVANPSASSSSTTIQYLHPKPLPSLPTALSAKGYELCSSCIEAAGVVHAVEASESYSPYDTPASPLSSSSSPSSSRSPSFPPFLPGSPPLSQSPSRSPSDESSLSVRRRAAPRQKGSLRHAYIEKVWGGGGWTKVEQDDTAAAARGCSACGSVIAFGRFKCVSCASFELCQGCYSQVHEIHPAHAFLMVPDPPIRASPPPQQQQPRSEKGEEDPDLALIPLDDGLGEKSLVHPGVSCAHCMQEIVGARFHCAICDNIDICSNCESAGLPGNLDSSDGGHTSTHIMIKIPYPLENREVLHASKRARHLWTDRDEPKVYGQLAPSSPKSSYARTVVGGGGGKSDLVIDSPWSHRVACNSCRKIIVGTRYQCASCPSLPSAFNLCAGCEARSHVVHDSMHIFFKINRPLDRPIESSFALLPTLYSQPVGLTNPSSVLHNPRDYLTELVHQSTYCDRCVETIIGEWFRCAYCPKDLCSDCERLDTHNTGHVFVVFKSTINMTNFRQFIDLDNPERTPPILPYPVYLQ